MRKSDNKFGFLRIQNLTLAVLFVSLAGCGKPQKETVYVPTPAPQAEFEMRSSSCGFFAYPQRVKSIRITGLTYEKRSYPSGNAGDPVVNYDLGMALDFGNGHVFFMPIRDEEKYVNGLFDAPNPNKSMPYPSSSEVIHAMENLTALIRNSSTITGFCQPSTPYSTDPNKSNIEFMSSTFFRFESQRENHFSESEPRKVGLKDVQDGQPSSFEGMIVLGVGVGVNLK